jgi:hypothetical protein
MLTSKPANFEMRIRIAAGLCAAAISATLLTGCGTVLGTANQVVGSGSSSTGRISGAVHGGQQPVSGSTIQLYAVTTGGYNAPATALLTNPVVSAADGSFSITGDYNCTGVDQVYIVATGGNPGLPGNASNGALALMAALGTCATLQANASTTFINLNEVTTVAGAWSLARFMNSPTNAGTSATNALGVENAFATANKIANIATGASPGPALPAGATLSVAEVNTLANILSACVNSTGATTSGTTCATLFAAATPPGGTAPVDTLTAALNIAHYPGNSVAALFSLATPSAVFQPALSAAPANWLIGIHHTGGGLAQPTGVAVDATGNVWVSNAANSVSEFSPVGAALSPAGGYTSGALSSPSAIAIDLSGNAWVANLTGSVTRLGPLGASPTNFTAGGFNQPSSIAIDGNGNVWVANLGNNSVSGLSSTGSVLPSTPVSGGGISAPAAIAVSAQ